MGTESYDAIVVGAGIAGPPLAAALAKQQKRVLLVERDWSEPDRSGCIARLLRLSNKSQSSERCASY